MTATTTPLPADLRRQYQEEGFFILPAVIPTPMLDMLRQECGIFVERCDREMEARGKTVDGIIHKGKRYFISNRYHESQHLYKFIFSELLAEVCRATLGPQAYLFHEQWVVKGPEQGMKFAWHQDSGYVGYPHRPYLTCWCPLDDVTEANGTVYILPHNRGGTRQTIHTHTQEAGTNDLVGYHGPDPGMPVICPAGSIVAFSSYTLHRSGANTTSKMRRVYLPQYSAAPILRPEGRLHAFAVPFLRDGRIVYDHATDR